MPEITSQFVSEQRHKRSISSEQDISLGQGYLPMSVNSKTHKSFAISQAKPTLFQPLQLETVNVDSYVKACQVARFISKPGQAYQTVATNTQSLNCLKPSIHEQATRHTGPKKSLLESKLLEDGGVKQKIAGDKAANFSNAITLNREVCQQNRELRRKAFSFNKAMKKQDVSQIAQNLNKLNKSTMEDLSETQGKNKA